MELKFSLFKLDISTITKSFAIRILGLSLFINKIEMYGPRYLVYIGYSEESWMVDLFFFHII